MLRAMKLPRVFVATTFLAGCSSPSSHDAGDPDAGRDGGEACTRGSPCDAGAGLPAGECVQMTESDGGHVLRCELLI
jgi:hypothetical protein